MIKEMSKKVEVKIYSVDEFNAPTTIQIIPKNLVGSFTIIDDKLLWVGAPIIVGTKYESEPNPPYYFAYLNAPETIAILKGNLGIDERFKAKK
ncbi:hypothetical protein [Neobacillus sp. SAB-20_R2A]|uniref:hypothetical protein n=1 Tax=Neobacillus sp. SAB-20_R2A TaxID=3120519 RepID=UPI003C6DE9B4